MVTTFKSVPTANLAKFTMDKDTLQQVHRDDLKLKIKQTLRLETKGILTLKQQIHACNIHSQIADRILLGLADEVPIRSGSTWTATNSRG